VIRKLDSIIASYQGQPAAYIHGVAKKVFLEYTRSRQRQTAQTLPDLSSTRVPATLPDPELEHHHACLEHCLAELDPEDRALILHYYRGDKWAKIQGRQRLAGQAQMSATALRKRTQRLRERLKTCLLQRIEGRRPGRARS
jgi:DNA-directed RNA polymerase specialized sigma24 family protein